MVMNIPQHISDHAVLGVKKVNLADVTDRVPAGTISAYGGAAAPTDWLLCDGSAVSRSTYVDLFNVIGTTYGVGDGSTTFNVPDYTDATVDISRKTTAFWQVQDGYGSTNTKITKFTTEVDASDDVVVTIVNDATDGFSITANMDCKIDVTFTAEYNTTGAFGISKNSTELTTSISLLTTDVDRMTANVTDAANRSDIASWSGIISSGDIIRPHCGGSVNGTTPAFGSITVVAIEILEDDPSEYIIKHTNANAFAGGDLSDDTPLPDGTASAGIGLEVSRDDHVHESARTTTAFWQTGAGMGSTNTKIREFTTEVDASDDVVVTVVNSAVDGFSITANMDCQIFISYSDAFSAAGYFGLSKNSSELTTDIHSLTTTADRISIAHATSASAPDTTSYAGELTTNDVIRPHTNGAGDAGGGADTFAEINVLAIEKL